MSGLSAIAKNGGNEVVRRNNESKNVYESGKAGESKKANAAKSEYGKTVGEPKLSEEGKKYYEELKKKYGNYDFVLVSSDQKENAKANASKYANSFKTVVLIDEEKIERMATDKDYRKKYEDILSGATAKLEQLKQSVQSSGAKVKGFGMQVNDNGTASFFAVLKKSSADQKARIEKKAAEKKEALKASKKAEQKKAREEGVKKTEKRSSEEAAKAVQKETREGVQKNAWTDFSKSDKQSEIEKDSSDWVTVSANSIEELMTKMEDYAFIERSNNVLSDSEKALGQNIDFRG